MNGRLLLASDLDDTLLGDAKSLEEFATFFESVRERVTLVYASGRFFDSIRQDVRTTRLPEPFAIAGGVGSEIRFFPGGEDDPLWIERISRGWSEQVVRRVLATEPDLELQPETSQSRFKVSYYLEGATPERLSALAERVAAAGVRASVVYSSGRDLDFLPLGVNKGAAVGHLADQLAIPRDRVIVSGDSGNDSAMFDFGFRGIVVANAHEDLKRYARGPRTYHAGRPRAAGVLEGLQYWLDRIDSGRMGSQPRS